MRWGSAGSMGENPAMGGRSRGEVTSFFAISRLGNGCAASPASFLTVAYPLPPGFCAYPSPPKARS